MARPRRSGPTVEQAATALGIPSSVIEGWIERRLIPSQLDRDRRRRVSTTAVRMLRDARGSSSAPADWSVSDYETVIERLGPTLWQASARPTWWTRVRDVIGALMQGLWA